MPTSVGMRRLFMVPIMVGSFFWISKLLEEVHEGQWRVKQSGSGDDPTRPHKFSVPLDYLEYGTQLPAKVVKRLWQHDVAKAALLEYAFLSLFMGVAVVCLYGRRGGGTVYTLLSFLTAGFHGLALCSFVIPVTTLEQQAVAQKTTELKNKDKQPGRLPVASQWFYTAVCTVLVLGVTGAALDHALKAGLLGYTAKASQVIPYAVLALGFLPLFMVIGCRSCRNGVNVDSASVRRMMWVWVVLGACVAAVTRFAWNSDLFMDLVSSVGGDVRLTDKLHSVFAPTAPGREAEELWTKGLRLGTGYAAFAAQVLSISACVLLFSIFDADATVPLWTKVVLAPLYLLAPTVAVPLCFAIRHYHDSEYAEILATVKVEARKNVPVARRSGDDTSPRFVRRRK